MAELSSAEEQLTSERSERKYAISPDRVRALVRGLTERVPRHRHGSSEGIAPGRAYTTTVYFDTPMRALYEASQVGESHVRVRAREYYVVHPSLTEVVRDPTELVRYDPVVWIEIKRRRGDHVAKTRVGVPKRELPRLFAEGHISSRATALQQELYGAAASEVLAEAARLSGEFGGRLGADSLVSYRRLAWQDPGGRLRLTLDRDIAVFSPPGDLWERQLPLIRETLGTAAPAATGPVLEIKARGEHPAWLGGLLMEVEARAQTFSKFQLASEAVHAQ